MQSAEHYPTLKIRDFETYHSIDCVHFRTDVLPQYTIYSATLTKKQTHYRYVKPEQF